MTTRVPRRTNKDDGADIDEDDEDDDVTIVLLFAVVDAGVVVEWVRPESVSDNFRLSLSWTVVSSSSSSLLLL